MGFKVCGLPLRIPALPPGGVGVASGGFGVCSLPIVDSFLCSRQVTVGVGAPVRLLMDLGVRPTHHQRLSCAPARSLRDWTASPTQRPRTCSARTACASSAARRCRQPAPTRSCSVATCSTCTACARGWSGSRTAPPAGALCSTGHRPRSSSRRRQLPLPQRPQPQLLKEVALQRLNRYQQFVCTV